MIQLNFHTYRRRGSMFWRIIAILVGISHFSCAWCPPTESHKHQDQFFKCARTMDAADQNGDDRLDYIEYENYLRYLALTLYTVPLFKDEMVPEGFDPESVFDLLVEAGGSVVNENGDPQIDIYGSNIEDMPLADKSRFEALHEICDQTVEAFESIFADLAPGMASPKLLVLHNVVSQNEETGGGGLELDADVLSIHSSFIIANFEGLEALDVDIGPWSRMLDSYHNFLNELMQTVCPADGETYTECWEDPDASYDSAYDSESGRLCGSHAEYIRRMFCDIRRQRRSRALELDRVLEPDHRIENIVLYAAQESRCPVPMISQGKGGGHHPLCQTIFAHYLLHLHDLDVGDKEKLEGVYTNITQSAIHNGMLQDSLEEVNPNSDYIVEGAGPQVTPIVHKHHAFHRRRLACRQRFLQESSYDGKALSENYRVWLDNNRSTVHDKASKKVAADDRFLKLLPQRKSLRL